MYHTSMFTVLFYSKKWSKVIQFLYSKPKDVLSRMCLVKMLGCMINKRKHIKWITELDANNDGGGEGSEEYSFQVSCKHYAFNWRMN